MKKFTLTGIMLMAVLFSSAQTTNETVNDYGRLRNISYDTQVEDKMYANTLNNHIVVSYDNGATWDLQYSFPNSRAQIDNLKVVNSEILCFSVQNTDDSDGLYFYNIEDGEIINNISLPEGAMPDKFDIYGEDASTMIVSITSGSNKVYYTTTSGENWNLIYDSADYNDISVWNVAIDPENPAKIFIVRGAGPTDVDGGLLISEDSGETFTEALAGIELNSIGINPFDTNDMIAGALSTLASDNKLYRSADGGVTWNPIAIDWTEDDYQTILYIKFHPTVEGTIFALEDNEIVYSNNDGVTWDVTVYEDITEYNYGLSLSLNPNDNKEAAIATNYYPVITRDGGVSVDQIKNPYASVARVYATKFEGTEHLYYTIEGGFVHKNYETNSSNAYDIMDPGMIGGSEMQIVADPVVEGRIFTYAGGFMGKTLSVSTDHGATKTDILSDFAPNLKKVIADIEDVNTIYVLLDNFDQGLLYKLDISDLTNVQSTPITLPDGGPDTPLRDLIIIDGEAGDELYIAKGNKMFTSSDDGINWTEMEVPGESSINDIAVNAFDANEWAIATNEGIFTTTDKGANWIGSNENAPAGTVEFSDVQDGIMAAGVYENESSNSYITYYNGTNWVNIAAAEIEYAQSYMMDFNFEDGIVTAYISTVDMGVIRYEFEIDETAGINDVVSEKLNIFPNPSSGIIQVNTGNDPVTKIELYNITGQKVLESASGTIDMSRLNSGIYIVKAETTAGKSLSAKVVRQ